MSVSGHRNSDKTPLLVNGDDQEREKHKLKKYSPEDDESSTSSVADAVTDVTVSANHKTPCFVFTLTIFSAIGGFLFGYDTGVVSGAMLLLRKHFDLTDVMEELIVSITIGGAAIFSLIGGKLNDVVGRKPTTLIASLVFTMGAIVLGLAVNTTMLLIGRFVLGIGIGFASATVPMYIAECAPTDLRGRLVTLNNIFITGGQLVASIVDALFSKDTVNGWRYMLGFAGIPSVIQLIGFFFMPESPRWLIMKGKDAQARKILTNIRGGSNVDSELEHIKQVCEEDRQTLASTGNKIIIWEMLCAGHVRRALIVGCLLQAIQQLAGINTVMYYSATIIKMSGVKNIQMAIWLAAITAFTNFIFTFLGLWLVEKVGRRKLTLYSLAGTCLSLAFLAIGFQLAARNSPSITYHYPSFNASCTKYSSCDSCVTDSSCGFCFDEISGQTINGSCLPVQYNKHIRDEDRSSMGRCNTTNLGGNIVWAYDYCPTSFSWMALVGLIMYLAFFASGMGITPWIVNSEIYPLWARSRGNSISTTTNWIFNLFISMTFLTFTKALTRYGAFYLYAGLAFVGILLLAWLLPETKGKKLEEVEDLFKKPWFDVNIEATT